MLEHYLLWNEGVKMRYASKCKPFICVHHCLSRHDAKCVWHSKLSLQTKGQNTISRPHCYLQLDPLGTAASRPLYTCTVSSLEHKCKMCYLVNVSLSHVSIRVLSVHLCIHESFHFEPRGEPRAGWPHQYFVRGWQALYTYILSSLEHKCKMCYPIIVSNVICVHPSLHL